MECSWEAALLEKGTQLPAELLDVIQNNRSNEQYLETIVRASLDARYTDLLFAHCGNIFAHVSASVRAHGSLAASIATLARFVPFAPYLAPYATQLLSGERYILSATRDKDEDLSYLLGLFRLLRHDCSTYKQYVELTEIQALLQSSSRPIIYLSIRILQICLDGADYWFEGMVQRYLGEDTPDGGVDGLWDDRTIDYRFLSLWEEERDEKMSKLLMDATSDFVQPPTRLRVIPEECLHPTTTLIGGILFPRAIHQQTLATPVDTLVRTPTVSTNLKSIANALKSPSPVFLIGLAGSGKTLLTRYAAQKLGRAESMVTLHLNEQSDAKLLIGIYTTGDDPGSFIWKPGVLTTAVQEGRWVLIEDFDRAPNEIIGTLLPLIERRELMIPNRKQTIHAAPGFRLLASVRSTINHRGEKTRPLANMLGARHWQIVGIDMPPVSEQAEIVCQIYPSLAQFLPQLMAVFERLQTSQHHAVLVGQSKTGILRATSPRDLLKWCTRITKLLQHRPSFTSHDMDDIFMEAIDCFVGALPDGPARRQMAAVIAEELRIDPQRRDYLLTEREVRYDVDKSRIAVGRYSLSRTSRSTKSSLQSTFSTNPHTSRMLERVAAAVVNREPLLLVGETGVGKTTAVQHLASHLGKKLEPFNLSQQSEAGDLLGGFKPVTARNLIVPMKDEFDELFRASFSMSKNQQFLELLGKQMLKSNWRAVCKLWQQALRMVDQQRPASPSRQGEAPSKKRKVDPKRALDFARWDVFAANVADIERRLASGTGAFAFSFVEGNIVKAVRNGDWVLLDEINLASSDTLEAIADLLDPVAPSLLLTEAGNIARVEAHPDFRVFGAMNPATDVGKKDLSPGIRSRFTELYVESPDKDIKSLQSIVRSYLRTEATSDQPVALDVSSLYQSIIRLAEQNKLVDGAGQKPHFSLRTLTRTLSYAKYIAPQCTLRRALYEGFQMSFLTFLDTESAHLVQPMLEQHLFGKRTNVRGELQKVLRKPEDGHQYIQGYPGSKHWVRQGGLLPEEQPHYILTPFIKSNLENLVRATSTRQFPVLIQGPTSSGKTSMIEYLAKRTGHQFVRINNHEHTDLQEYLGTYVSGADGRLQFQEGILVRALREGHWIVLDELNLAPTDVLEALNRLLDDNRELLVPETQETIRPHKSFMLFATQNPAGLYGGRKALSRAFRNRFLELHFDDIPIDELQDILHRRTQLPDSRCKRIVTVYRELSVLRQENRLFEQKSFATLRDLFRWALRPNDTIEEVAANGFMLLAERVRNQDERRTLKEVIEKVMSAKGPRITVDEGALYAETIPEIQAYQQHAHSHGVVWTRAMRRLYALVSRAIQNNEPVLLVGETGCGKTTVCQMLAEAFSKKLHIVNAHQNTETGDLIGSQRPVRNRGIIETQLRSKLLSSKLLQGLETAAAHSTDALLDAYERALSSLSEAEKLEYCTTTLHVNIQSDRTRFNALFEWTDGSLVQAMKEGSFFLLDEISLADDSVLERLNSVLESQRSILLAEKGSVDAFVSAAPGFQFFATMNPGGDYGKRELSPALRNRFTEIWVPALSDNEDVVQIMDAKLGPPAKAYARAMVSFANWFKDRYNTSASSSISIRDSLAWVQFVNSLAAVNVTNALVHGAAMVYIDTLGANPAGLMTLTGRNLDEERVICLSELSRLTDTDAAMMYAAAAEVNITDQLFEVGPFAVPRRSSDSARASFTFDAPTTRTNAMRVVRAMQLSKPVMLEGSPGVGKTALVTAIAKAVGVPLTRINLSEQTDLLDLFGSDAPVEGAETGTFAWRDAPFLRAMKSGEWVLLDEMNLASQSVLEGLNACLDHRGEVFVPELGQSFTKHPEFRLFAAQNPHHQGGGRKGLPASFVNRFTVVYADAFRPQDLMLICQRTFPEIDALLVEQAVHFVNHLELEISQRRRFGAHGGPWEFNLRDISRWLALATSKEGLLRAGTARDFVDLLFSQRFRSVSDRASVDECFFSVFSDTPSASDLFCSISPQTLQVGLARLPRNVYYCREAGKSASRLRTREHLQALQSLMVCVQQRWPVILTGPTGAGKTSLITDLAALVGTSVKTISLNAETDTMDLLGGYEQADPVRQSHHLLSELQGTVASAAKASLLMDPKDSNVHDLVGLNHCVDTGMTNTTQIAELASAMQCHTSAHAQNLIRRILDVYVAIDKARFEWIDGILVDALVQGKWLVLDNANLCSASVLDRLNSLLEPNGTLIVNEHTEDDGTPRTLRPHADFRIFLTTDPRHGELSRAMRNRAVELYIHAEDQSVVLANPPGTESALVRFRQAKVMDHTVTDVTLAEQMPSLIFDHLGLCDQALLPRFCLQARNGLYDHALGDLFENDAAMPVESQHALDDFYKMATSQADMSADFARVQTVHPLNNQALIQQTQQLSIHAFALAFKHDVHVRLAGLQTELMSIKSDKAIAQQIQRADRSLRSSLSTRGPQVGILGTIEASLQTVSQWVQQFHSHDLTESAIMKLTLYRLCALWLCVLRLMRSSNSDGALLVVWIRTVSDIIGAMSAQSVRPLTTLLSRVQQYLEALTSKARSLAGRACGPLWSALRPATPISLEHLDAMLHFERVVGRFDRACQSFPLPLQDLTELRSSFTRALSVRTIDAGELRGLSDRLETLVPRIGEPHSDGPTYDVPHFRDVFETLSQRYALLNVVDGNGADSGRGLLEILAGRSTLENVDVSLSQSSGHGRILLQLSKVLPHTTTGHAAAQMGEWQKQTLDKLLQIDQVPLGQLGLLESECQILSKIVATDARRLYTEDISHLDICLERLCRAVLQALTACTTEPELVALASPLLASLEASSDNMHEPSPSVGTESTAATQLQTVVRYLNHAPTDKITKLREAAKAWIAFALASLTLYVGEQPFDPAMRPLLERETYRHCRNELVSEHHALRALRTVLFGRANSLRLNSIQEDILRLGLEPVADNVCRPSIPQLTQLHDEMRGLLRAIQPMQEGITAEDDSAHKQLLTTNLNLIRDRLKHQYRAYTDLTLPVVGFIDCLRIARELELRATPHLTRTKPVVLLETIIPLVSASLKTWSSDETFATLFSGLRDPQEKLYCLSLLRARSSVRPFALVSKTLQDAVEDLILHFYEQWKAELGYDQRKAAAKTSLYRYQGDVDLNEEVSEGDLDELFPTGASESADGADIRVPGHQTQKLVAQLARIHHALFVPGHISPEVVLDLLRQYSKLRSARDHLTDIQSLIPTILLKLQDNVRILDTVDKAHGAYNIYTDPNIPEIKKLSQLVRKVRARFASIHEAWPEHATPVEIARLCDQLFAVSHSTSVMGVLQSIEKLHATTCEWQKVASREYSAQDLLEELTSLIVAWRQLELSSWAGLLERESASCERDAMSWWFVAYENILAAPASLEGSQIDLRQHAESLLKTLEVFLASSGIGEFTPRLNILRAFVAHLNVSARWLSMSDAIAQALGNFVNYFQRFEPVVAERLAKGRADLEKEIKNVIQVASWKDRNVEILKQSAKSSHKRLLRLVRRFRNLLAQPVVTIVQGGVPDQQQAPVDAMLPQDATGASTSAYSEPTPSNQQLSAWGDRPDRFKHVGATIGLMRAMAGRAVQAITAATRISSFMSEMKAAITELQKATPSTLTEKNKSAVQHLKSRKRRLLADVLKEVRDMGFQVSLSEDVLARQGSLHVVLARSPTFAEMPTVKIRESEFHFHRLLGKMPAVRESARKHSEDLTSAEAARCLSLLESMLQTVVSQRANLHRHLREFTVLQNVVKQLENFATSENAVSDPDFARTSSLQSMSARCLSMIAPACMTIINAQLDLSGTSDSTMVAEMSEIVTQLRKLDDELTLKATLPDGIADRQDVMLQSRYDELIVQMRSCTQAAYDRNPEFEAVLTQLWRWVYAPAHRLSDAQTNGHSTDDANSWIVRLLRTLDHILAAVQDLRRSTSPLEEGKAWLHHQHLSLDDKISALHLPEIVKTLADLLSQVARCGEGSDGSLSPLVMVANSVKPIVTAYSDIVKELLDSLCALHLETTSMASQLATTFLHLAQQGFCTPTERAGQNEQSNGDVESGTGLGEGEGAEDISKDIGDDEDLSELAHQPNTEEQYGNMGDEKDAVDMADEEMEGASAEQDEASPDEADQGDEQTQEDTADVEQQAGEVDDLGPSAVDEKMWDEGNDPEQADREADNTSGSTKEQDLAAAEEKDGQRKESDNDQDVQDAAPPDDEAEGVKQQETENLDPTVGEEQTLELPDDIDMDNTGRAEETDSDLGDVSGTDDEAEQPTDASAADNAETKEDHLDEEGTEQIDTGAEPDQRADDEGAEVDGDQASDILMQDQPVGADEMQDEAVFGESGTGADENQAQAPKPNSAAMSEPQADAPEGDAEQQQTEAGASGAQTNDHDQERTSKSEDTPNLDAHLPFKEIGDALNEWYKQHREIESAKESADTDNHRQEDVNMADARFEHVPESDATADTQALGAASAEQSSALDEAKGLPVNEENDPSPAPFDEQLNQELPDSNDSAPDERTQVEPSDNVGTDSSKAFVGKSNNADVDHPMEDEPTMESNYVDDVDQQFTNTHISPEDPPSGMCDEEARNLWSGHEDRIRNLALVLTEHLRLILQPTQATKMRGDFRTGKRLNIKRIIPYIASSYKRDKIWMRRSIPSKRAYQVMLAIDDSKSMAESESRHLAFDTLALVAKSMSMLEVGELGVVGFGEGVKVAHDFSTPFNTDAGATVLKDFTFAQTETNVRKLLAESIELFRSARLKAAGASSELWQLQLIISDGVCEDHGSIRELVRQAREERIMVVFIVVDATTERGQAASGTKQSILDLQTAEFAKDSAGEMQLNMVKYLDTFPFDHYLIVRDVHELPGVLAGALRQWFAEVVETSS